MTWPGLRNLPRLMRTHRSQGAPAPPAAPPPPAGHPDKGPQLLVAMTSVGTGAQSLGPHFSWREQSLRKGLLPCAQGR